MRSFMVSERHKKLKNWLIIYHDRLAQMVRKLDHVTLSDSVSDRKVLSQIRSAISNFKAALASDDEMITLLQSGAFDKDLNKIDRLEIRAVQLIEKTMKSLQKDRMRITQMLNGVRKYRSSSGYENISSVNCSV